MLHIVRGMEGEQYLQSQHEKSRLHLQTAQHIRKFLCSLNQTGLQAGSTYVHFLCASVNLNSNGLHIGIPDSVRLSIGMTYIVAKKNTLCADFTLSHHRTSLTKLGGLVYQTTRNSNIIAEVI